MNDWTLVAQVIAHRDVSASTRRPRTSMDAELSAALEMAPTPKRETAYDLGQIEELNRIVAARPPQFRVQFLGAVPGSDLTVLKEVGVEAADLSAAIVAAATMSMPPNTSEMRIVDRESREVFSRQRAHRY